VMCRKMTQMTHCLSFGDYLVVPQTGLIHSAVKVELEFVIEVPVNRLSKDAAIFATVGLAGLRRPDSKHRSSSLSGYLR